MYSVFLLLEISLFPLFTQTLVTFWFNIWQRARVNLFQLMTVEAPRWRNLEKLKMISYKLSSLEVIPRFWARSSNLRWLMNKYFTASCVSYLFITDGRFGLCFLLQHTENSSTSFHIFFKANEIYFFEILDIRPLK